MKLIVDQFISSQKQFDSIKMTEQKEDGAEYAKEFFKRMQNRTKNNPQLDKTAIYEFILGPSHLVPGYRLDIYEKEHIFDYTGLGMDKNYVDNFVSQLRSCFTENGYHVKSE